MTTGAGSRSDWLLIPNLLTLTRFAAAACIPIAFAVADARAAVTVAFGLFVYASLTDFFDGWLARRLNQTSALGAKMDTLADKALLLATLAPLCVVYYADALWFWAGAAVIALRELGVTWLRSWRPNATALKVRRDAKWKTAAQMSSVSLLLAAEVFVESGTFYDVLRIAGLGLFAVAVVLSATTGLAYLRGALAAAPPR